MLPGTPRTLDATLAESMRVDAEFRGVTQSANRNALGGRTDDATGSTNPYERAKVHIAYGYGLTGAGVKIGVVDSGFNLVSGKPAHDEFSGSGKLITLVSAPVVTSDAHGSHVSGLAAAQRDGKIMQGVAYGATLYLGETNTTPEGFKGIFDEYRTAGVTVSSNSYGVPVKGDENSPYKPVKTSDSYEVTAKNVLAYQASASLSSSQTLANVQGGTAAGWTDAIASFRAYRDAGGVTVFANSNYGANDIANGNKGLDDADLMAALPLLVPELQGGWIAVVNATSRGLAIQESGQAYVDAATKKEGNIVLNSAQCGLAAAFCISQDGVAVNSASNTGVSSYTVQTGTSQATPMVAGMIALLREAFPTASAADISARLLFTADNSFFVNDPNTPAGEKEFTVGYTNANGTISHVVSSIWGHGFANMDAALKPVGATATGTARGRSISTADLHQALSASAAFGTGASPLAGATYLYNDQLNGIFAGSLANSTVSLTNGRFATMAADQGLQAATGVATSGSGLRMMFGRAIVPDANGTSARNARVFSLQQQVGAVAQFGVGFGLSPDTQLGFATRHALLRSASPTDAAMGIPLLAFGSHDQRWLSAGFAHSGVRTTVAMFNGGRTARPGVLQLGNERTSGVVADAVFDRVGPFSLNLSAGRTSERDGLLGSRSRSTVFGLGGNSDFIRLGVAGRITSKIGYQANYTTASTVVSSEREGLIANGSRLRSDAFAFALTADNLIGRESRLSASVAQPLRVGSSRATLTLPSGVQMDSPGAWHYTYGARAVNLAPSGRELDYTVEYSKAGHQQNFRQPSGFRIAPTGA